MGKHTTITVDDWVDRFVEHVNHSDREPKSGKDIPPWLRGEARSDEYTYWDVAQPDEYTDFDWQIRKVERTQWIEELESKLPYPFPPSFHSLVSRYAYPDFTVGPLWLLANTGEPLFYEMSDTIQRDVHLSKTLAKHGYLHFARPDTGSYDPVCFDTRRRLKNGEYPIVQVEHEAILCFDRIGDVTEIAPSFLAFVTDVVERAAAAAGFYSG